MSIIRKLEKDILTMIEKAGYKVEDFQLQKSNRPDLGVYQINDCMNLSKIYHKNPRDIAEDIVEELNKDKRLTNINVAGPGFINISLSDDYLIEALNNTSLSTNDNLDKKDKKKVVMDYGGANVAKALHVGHLRSANLGEALKRLARLLGYEVISDAHLGDYGRPLGLVLLEIKKRYPDLEYFKEDYVEGTDIEIPITNDDLEEIYPTASNKAKVDEEYLEEARIMTNRIQNHEKGYYDLWKKVVEISKDDIKPVYDELNVEYDLWEGESDAEPYIEELLDICNSKNVVKDSDGAKIIEVKEEDDTSPMPPLLLIKSNNTYSYETTDLATILERKKKLNPDEIWYLTDARQQLHFEQVFRAARKIDLVDKKVNLENVSFGTMNGNDGKPFKTRDGGVMTLKNLIQLVKEETKKHINYDIVSEDILEDTIQKIAIATLKYADFIPYRTTDYIFNIEKFSDIEGKTGPYLLYSAIRMKSLLSKGSSYKQEKLYKIKDETDKEIILTLLELPRVLTTSLDNRSLNDIADYLYILTNKYNKLYAENRILDEADEELRSSWLVLTKTVYNIVTLLLDILGIKVPEKM